MSERTRYRKAIDTQVCPECGKGPYKSLPQHMTKAHEIDRFEFRNRAEVPQSMSITSLEVSDNSRRRALKENMGERVTKYSKSIKGKKGIERNIPDHSRQRIGQTFKRYRESMTDEEYQAHAKRASDSRTEAGIRRQAEAMKQWHKDNPMTEDHREKLMAGYRDPETQKKLADWNKRRRQPCGSVAAYKRGCRCEPCRQAKRESRKK